jgi:hypothetical protein
MSSSVGGSKRQQKVGGMAALYLAAAFIVAMPFFLVFVKYPSVVDPVEKVALLVRHHDSMQVMYLVTYIVFGLVLGVVALALHARLRDGAPALAQAATTVALTWAVVLVASGMVFNAGMAAVVGLHGTDPAQAVSAWQAIEPVAQGLGGSGGAPRRSVGPAGERGCAAHQGTAQGAQLAGSGDRRRGRPLGRAGPPGPEVRLWAAGHRVVRVAGRRHGAHTFTSACSGQHRRDHLGLCCRELDSAQLEEDARATERVTDLIRSPFPSGAGGVPPQGMSPAPHFALHVDELPQMGPWVRRAPHRAQSATRLAQGPALTWSTTW